MLLKIGVIKFLIKYIRIIGLLFIFDEIVEVGSSR